MSRPPYNCIMFDVDETLQVSGGPIPMRSLALLALMGNIVGICGNFAPVVQRVHDWHKYISLIKISNERKHEFLSAVKKYVPANRYIMVGNVNPANSPYSDKDEAKLAGWEFIAEQDFKI